MWDCAVYGPYLYMMQGGTPTTTQQAQSPGGKINTL